MHSTKSDPVIKTWLKGALHRSGGDYVILNRVYAVSVGVRFFLAFFAVFVNLTEALPQAENPLLVFFACAVILCWTVYVSLHMRNEANRTTLSHVADVGVTLAVMMITPYAMGGAPFNPTLAGFWMAGCALYGAIFLSTLKGLLAAAVACITFVLIPPITLTDRLDVVLMTLVTTISMGVMTTQVRHAVAVERREQVNSAALAERERLARIVHDGALQVLALVEREGPALGPRGLRLAKLARDSESQLRTLLQDRDISNPDDDASVDLASVLDRYDSARITVSTMAGQIFVARHIADEVVATLTEALTNVYHHAGDDAKVWILLDQEHEEEVILWIRDNGVGMTAEVVAEAAERGRMGIKDSIVGRMSALGGSAILTSHPGSGTEWELRFPVSGGAP